MRRRQLLLLAALAGGLVPPARAHGTRAGDLRIEHAYALPSAAGSDSGVAFLRLVRNRGDQPDRLLGAHSPVAASVELQQNGQAVPAILLPPNADTPLRHDGPWRLLLKGLKQPLTTGQRVALVLRFERAGECEVSAWVQPPRAAGHAH